MARKQARRKRIVERRRWRPPVLPWRAAAFAALAVAAAYSAYRISAFALDRPIRSITIEAPFQRVTAMQIEEAVSPELGTGFLSADLERIRGRVRALPWVDRASVARRWPDALVVTVSEQIPAARWGRSGLLNVHGELFVDELRHAPAELPRLSGPDGTAETVAARYLAIRGELVQAGLGLSAVRLDPRGAWRLTLGNGIEVRLGRRDADRRFALFLEVAAPLVASRAADIAYVDMRYTNGFSIGWKGDSPPDDLPGRGGKPRGSGTLTAERTG